MVESLTACFTLFFFLCFLFRLYSSGARQSGKIEDPIPPRKQIYRSILHYLFATISKNPYKQIEFQEPILTLAFSNHHYFCQTLKRLNKNCKTGLSAKNIFVLFMFKRQEKTRRPVHWKLAEP
jgi:hypothetical protein